ncbi:hypothetical protein ACWGS9_30485 [Bradyrhizobium sp. Arg314]
MAQFRRRTKLPAFSVQGLLQPGNVPVSRADELETADLEGHQFERDQMASRTKVGDIHQGKVRPELPVAFDAFIVIQEVAAAIKNEAVPVHFDGLGMMR